MAADEAVIRIILEDAGYTRTSSTTSATDNPPPSVPPPPSVNDNLQGSEVNYLADIADTLGHILGEIVGIGKKVGVISKSHETTILGTISSDAAKLTKGISQQITNAAVVAASIATVGYIATSGIFNTIGTTYATTKATVSAAIKGVRAASGAFGTEFGSGNVGDIDDVTSGLDEIVSQLEQGNDESNEYLAKIYNRLEENAKQEDYEKPFYTKLLLQYTEEKYGEDFAGRKDTRSKEEKAAVPDDMAKLPTGSNLEFQNIMRSSWDKFIEFIGKGISNTASVVLGAIALPFAPLVALKELNQSQRDMMELNRQLRKEKPRDYAEAESLNAYDPEVLTQRDVENTKRQMEQGLLSAPSTKDEILNRELDEAFDTAVASVKTREQTESLQKLFPTQQTVKLPPKFTPGLLDEPEDFSDLEKLFKIEDRNKQFELPFDKYYSEPQTEQDINNLLGSLSFDPLEDAATELIQAAIDLTEAAVALIDAADTLTQPQTGQPPPAPRKPSTQLQTKKPSTQLQPEQDVTEQEYQDLLHGASKIEVPPQTVTTAQPTPAAPIPQPVVTSTEATVEAQTAAEVAPDFDRSSTGGVDPAQGGHDAGALPGTALIGGEPPSNIDPSWENQKKSYPSTFWINQTREHMEQMVAAGIFTPEEMEARATSRDPVTKQGIYFSIRKEEHLLPFIEHLKRTGQSKPDWLAKGGTVGDHPGQPQGTDTVPAWLTKGEFVVNADAATANREELEDMNAEGMLGGGYVDYLAEGGEPDKKDHKKKDEKKPYDYKRAAREAAGTISKAGEGVSGAIGGSGEVTESLSKFGDTLSKVGAIIPGVGSAAIIAGEGLKTFSGVLNTINKTAERYGEYSPEIAQAQATVEIQQTMGDFRRAQEIGNEMSKFLVSQGELQQKFEDTKIKLLMKITPVVTQILEMIGGIMEAGEGVTSVIGLGLAPLAMLTKIASDWLGLEKDKKLDEYIVDPTSMLLDEKFMTTGDHNPRSPGWVPDK